MQNRFLLFLTMFLINPVYAGGISGSYDMIGITDADSTTLLAVAGSFSGVDDNANDTLELSELNYFSVKVGTHTMTKADLSSFTYDGDLVLMAANNPASLSVTADGAQCCEFTAVSPNPRTGSGPLLVSRQAEGSGLRTHMMIRVGTNGSPIDASIILGSFSIGAVDGLADIDVLATITANVDQLSGVNVFPDGRREPLVFDDGQSTPDPEHGANVEVHYQCGSPDIICWGSIDDFIDLWGDERAPVTRRATSKTSLMVMDAAGTTTPIVEHAFLANLPFVGSDADIDGVPDSLDNCITAANTDQRDTNGDDIGNACDSDINNDCFVNFLDSQFYSDNFFLPGDLDTDNNGDGLTNFADLMVLANQFFGRPGPSAAGCN